VNKNIINEKNLSGPEYSDNQFNNNKNKSSHLNDPINSPSKYANTDDKVM
jgi:hypothetical protein